MQHNKLGNYNVFNQSELLFLFFYSLTRTNTDKYVYFLKLSLEFCGQLGFMFCCVKKKSPHESLEIKVEIVFITIKYKYNSGAKNKTKN